MRLGVRAALTPPYAQMLELVYTSGLSPGAAGIEGSNPSAGTMRKWRNRETQQAQTLLSDRVCEFKSRLAHQLFA